jgi:hypothetical protein
MNTIINIIISLILGYLFIYIALFLSLRIHTFINIPILVFIHLNTIKILEYSSRFMAGINIGILHGILAVLHLNIYAIISTYVFYLLSPIELPIGELYGKAVNENDLQISEHKIKTIQFTLRFVNLIGYTISLGIIYKLTN